MNVSVLPSIKAVDDVDAHETVSVWLSAFGEAISSGDEAQVACLFEQHSHWRDVLAFTWHLTPCLGANEIAKGFVARQSAVKAQGFGLSDAAATRQASGPRLHRGDLFFCYRGWSGRGRASTGACRRRWRYSGPQGMADLHIA